MHIRKLLCGDIQKYTETLERLLRTCTDISFQEKISEQFYASKMEDMMKYLELERAYIWGAFEQHQLTGFLWAYELDTPAGRKLHIAYFAVLPEYESHGTGSALISAAESFANEKGIGKVELIVSKENIQALSFYLRHEYIEERCIMTKSIL